MSLERWLYVARHRLRSLLFSTRLEHDLADEVRDHLERHATELVAGGMPSAAAHDAARKAFGGVEQRKEECRETRGTTWLTDFGRDIRYAARLMRRAPAFSTVAVFSLGLGIGSTTAIFTLFDALLLKPLPVLNADELRVLYQELRVGGQTVKWGTSLPYSRYQELRDDPEVFSQVIAFKSIPDARVRTPQADAQSASALFVSDNYFSMLGIDPKVAQPPGRDTAAVAPQFVVLGDSYWRKAFAGAADAVGQTLWVNGVPFTVAGITPAGFFGLTIGRIPDFYLPLDHLNVAQPAAMPLRDQQTWTVDVVGRLRQGVSAQVATTRLTERWRFAEVSRAGRPELAVSALPLETGLTDLRTRFREPLTLLLAIVAILLLIACANVAGLLLARAAARRDEIAMRVATGASRRRLIRQLLAESFLLAAVAGAGGAVAATWIINALIALMPAGTIGTLALSLDLRALLFAIGISLFAALASGIVPAVYAVNADVASAMRERRVIGSRGGRLGRAFVVAQVTLAMILVTAAGLLLRTVRELTTMDPGFAVSGVVAVQVEPGARQYTGDPLIRYYADVTERLRAMPGAAGVSLAQFGFLTGAATTGTVDVPASTGSDMERLLNVYQVGAAYFTTLGVPLLQGRDFTDRDLTGTAVAALNQSAARHFFGADSPIGRTIVTSNRAFEIIALSGDVRAQQLREPPVPTFFVPYTTALRGRMTFLVRTADDAATPAAIARVVLAIDPEVPLAITTIDELHARSASQERLLAVLTTAFAASAVVLLTLGVYGMMAFAVAQRTSEIGVRLALGATRWELTSAMLRQPLLLVSIGGTLGLVITLATARFMAALLFGLTPHDPATLVTAMALVATVGVLASYIPIRRASRIDPVVALRRD